MPASKPQYREYPCSCNAPLSCEVPRQTVEQWPGSKFCMECGFPVVLELKAEISGRRDTYQITEFIGQRNLGRLYRCSQLSDNQPCILKEYLLPEQCFNEQEIRQRQAEFERLAAVTPVDSKLQDFRLLTAWEVIVDSKEARCYFISQGDTGGLPTLGNYLECKGAMKEWQVRKILAQLLQTLTYLHGQKFSINPKKPGLVHGGITLDSLLVRETEELFVYLCDLSMVERLFDPEQPPSANLEKQADLKALGLVALALLSGNEEAVLNDDGSWPSVTPQFREWLNRLVAQTNPFANAAAAAEALKRLPQFSTTKSGEGFRENGEEESRPKSWAWRMWVLGAVAMLFIGIGAVYLSTCCQSTPSTRKILLTGKFAEVNDVPILAKPVPYSAELDSTWSYILQFRMQSSQTVSERLSEPKSNFRLRFVPLVSQQDVDTSSAPIQAVRVAKAAFAVTSLPDTFGAGDLRYEPFAYDGLFVFVASSKKSPNLPKMLKGKLTIENLRDLFTGRTRNWKQLGGPDMPVEVFRPTEPEAVRQFERLVLGNDPQLVVLFRNHAVRMQTGKMLQQIYNDFDLNKVGGIGFGIISKTFNQCLIYPLALSGAGKTAVQGLVGPEEIQIDPTVPLCAKVYRPSVEAFTQALYPLSYPLAIVYPLDDRLPPVGRKFVEMLKTLEGQRILRDAGLVPLQPLPEEQQR
jgi:serine/threonine protein kinase